MIVPTIIKLRDQIAWSIFPPQFLLALMLTCWCNQSSILAQAGTINYPGALQAFNTNLDAFRLWYKPNREAQIGLKTGSAATLNNLSLNFPASAQGFLDELRKSQETWVEISALTDPDEIRESLEPFIPSLEALQKQAGTLTAEAISISDELISFSATVRTTQTISQQKLDQVTQDEIQNNNRQNELNTRAANERRQLSAVEGSEVAGLVIASIQNQNDIAAYRYYVNEYNRLLTTLNGLTLGITDCLNHYSWASAKLEAAQHDAQKAMETESEGAFDTYQKIVVQAMDQLFTIL